MRCDDPETGGAETGRQDHEERNARDASETNQESRAIHVLLISKEGCSR